MGDALGVPERTRPRAGERQRWTVPQIAVLAAAAAIMLATIAITDDPDVLCYVIIALTAVIYPLRKLVW